MFIAIVKPPTGLFQTGEIYTFEHVFALGTAGCAEQGLLKRNPFDSIDQGGVGDLVRLGVERGRSTKPKLKIGVCGEHGGDPDSIDMFYRAGLDYVSCSPFRVPIARLAAAHAALNDK